MEQEDVGIPLPTEWEVQSQLQDRKKSYKSAYSERYLLKIIQLGLSMPHPGIQLAFLTGEACSTCTAVCAGVCVGVCVITKSVTGLYKGYC